MAVMAAQRNAARGKQWRRLPRCPAHFDSIISLPLNTFGSLYFAIPTPFPYTALVGAEGQNVPRS